MKLYRFDGGETDWIAARNEDEARRHYLTEYGLGAADLDDVVVREVDDPAAVIIHWSDEVDAETGECRQETAAQFMDGVVDPCIVCSTANAY